MLLRCSVGCRCGCLADCGGVFWVGGGFELESGLQISKLAWGLILGPRALVGPILKLERPTPAARPLQRDPSRFRGEWGMVIGYRITLAASKALAGGSAVALTPAGAGSVATGGCLIADLAFGGQRLGGQGGQVGQPGHLIDMPVKKGFDD